MKDNPNAQAQYSSELKQKVEAIIKSREILKQQNEELEERLRTMQVQLEELRSAKPENISSNYTVNNEETEALRTRLEMFSSENNMLLQQVSALQEENNDLKSTNAKLESDKGNINEEEITKYLGSLLVEAKNTAQRVVNDAHDSVRSVKSEAADISLEVSGELSRLKQEIQEMRESVKSVMDSFSNKLDMLDRMTDSAGNGLKKYQHQK